MYSAASGTWTTANWGMPTALEGVAAVTGADGLVYAIGGYDGCTPYNSVNAYNPGTHTWAAKANLPNSLFDMAAAPAPSGTIYAMGGYDATLTHVSSSVYAYSTASRHLVIGRCDANRPLWPRGRDRVRRPNLRRRWR